jgi:hypothetical protein
MLLLQLLQVSRGQIKIYSPLANIELDQGNRDRRRSCVLHGSLAISIIRNSTMQISMTGYCQDAENSRRDGGDRKDLSTGLSLSFDTAMFARSRKSAIFGDWHIGTITPSDEHQIGCKNRPMKALLS